MALTSLFEQPGRARAGRTARWGSVAVTAGLSIFMGVSAFGVYRWVWALGSAPGRSDCADAVAFLRSVSDPSTVVLTSNAWMVSWEAERPAVNAPTGEPSSVIVVAEHYGAEWAFTGPTVVGGLDLDGVLAIGEVAEALKPRLEFDGAICDVHRLRPSPARFPLRPGSFETRASEGDLGPR
jgi:hypothetical protein